MVHQIIMHRDSTYKSFKSIIVNLGPSARTNQGRWRTPHLPTRPQRCKWAQRTCINITARDGRRHHYPLNHRTVNMSPSKNQPSEEVPVQKVQPVDYNKVLGKYPYVPTREPELELAMYQYSVGLYFRRTASQLKDDAERERRAAGKKPLPPPPPPDSKQPEKRKERSPPPSDDPPGTKERSLLQAKALQIGRTLMQQRPPKRQRRK